MSHNTEVCELNSRPNLIQYEIGNWQDLYQSPFPNLSHKYSEGKDKFGETRIPIANRFLASITQFKGAPLIWGSIEVDITDSEYSKTFYTYNSNFILVF